MSSKYSESGVDIDAAAAALKGIGSLVKETWGREVLSEVGNFGGLFELSTGYRNPVLVSSTDGVGTKLRLAFISGKHDSVGEDLVNHCVNDILVQGAEPLFFLDYFGCGKLEKGIVESVVKGMARGCKENRCALIGGETAEMPGFYAEGEYDLAGTIVGIVERDELIDGSTIREGDGVWAFPSSGLHTNGYSLARKIIFEDQGLGIDDEIPGTGKTVANNLMAVHRSYLPEIKALRKVIDIRGLAHITGGGLIDNIPRILPGDCGVEIFPDRWEEPRVFSYLREKGRVDDKEMYRVFNMGIGMIMIIPPSDEEKLDLAGLRWEPFPIGNVVKGEGKVSLR
ncbi:MAG: phosphoribosylformylglycinamidine cyclo-ligase [Candidatus Krumholzibacteriota bacterium]|nr:phosphoribosylformylglycinamidine cyclo-ligase [Candidatus Krumholzibacteriota bacterium]